MIDVTFLAMIVGFALAGLVPTSEEQRGAAWTLGDWVELAVAGTVVVVLAIYVWRFVGADLRLAPVLPNGAGGAVMPGLDADDLRALVSAVLPSLLFGALAGYLLRRAVQQLDVKLLLGAALTLLFPSLITFGPRVADYVNEVKTPWFEAKLNSAVAAKPPDLRFLNPSPTGGRDFTEQDFKSMRRGDGSHADLGGAIARVSAVQQGFLEKGSFRDHLSGLEFAPDRLAFEEINPTDFPAPDTLRTTQHWLQAYMEPFLQCTWSSWPYPWDGRDVWSDPARLGAALLQKANQAIAANSQLAADERKSLTVQFVQSLGEALSRCDPARVLPTGEGSERLNRLCADKPDAPACAHVPFTPPAELAQTAIPYIAVARLYRRAGEEANAVRFLKGIRVDVLPKADRARLLLERADLQFRLRLIEDALEDQRAAIGLYRGVLNGFPAESLVRAADFECAAEPGPVPTDVKAFADLTYILAQAKNSFAFETASAAAGLPEARKDAVLAEARYYAADNYDALPTLERFHCLLGGIGNAGTIYADTYAVALLTVAARSRDFRQRYVEHALDLLDEAERRAVNNGDTGVRQTIQQHREAAEVLL